MKPLVENKALCALLAAVTVGMGVQTDDLVRVHEEREFGELRGAEAPAPGAPAGSEHHGVADLLRAADRSPHRRRPNRALETRSTHGTNALGDASVKEGTNSFTDPS